jgi:hypothetical protein
MNLFQWLKFKLTHKHNYELVSAKPSILKDIYNVTYKCSCGKSRVKIERNPWE